MSNNQITLEELYKITQNKILAKEEGSYSYEIAKQGVAKTTRKVGEEAVEVVVAAFINDKNPTEKNKEDLIGEVGDLLYHTLLLLAEQKIEFTEVLELLEKRNKVKK